ncbi:DUF2254 family protein [Methanococcus voltae]|uniref:DUF2254 family protein n=1 Tax=Methanococcus voltae TaxID=2188 RepID=UPI001AEB8123|nr:DUF2254 family protein [Methanococcus voltae]MBP2173288.1 hypothetical protein [Methanococcus voltae]
MDELLYYMVFGCVGIVPLFTYWFMYDSYIKTKDYVLYNYTSLVLGWMVIILAGFFGYGLVNMVKADFATLLYNLAVIQATVGGLLITLTLVAVQLTAQRYSESFNDIFLKSRNFWFLIGSYALSIVFDLVLVSSVNLNFIYNLLVFTAFGLFLFNLVYVLPYIQITLDNLKPENVLNEISKVSTTEIMTYLDFKYDRYLENNTPEGYKSYHIGDLSEDFVFSKLQSFLKIAVEKNNELLIVRGFIIAKDILERVEKEINKYPSVDFRRYIFYIQSCMNYLVDIIEFSIKNDSKNYLTCLISLKIDIMRNILSSNYSEDDKKCIVNYFKVIQSKFQKLVSNDKISAYYVEDVLEYIGLFLQEIHKKVLKKDLDLYLEMVGIYEELLEYILITYYRYPGPLKKVQQIYTDLLLISYTIYQYKSTAKFDLVFRNLVKIYSTLLKKIYLNYNPHKIGFSNENYVFSHILIQQIWLYQISKNFEIKNGRDNLSTRLVLSNVQRMREYAEYDLKTHMAYILYNNEILMEPLYDEKELIIYEKCLKEFMGELEKLKNHTK